MSSLRFNAPRCAQEEEERRQGNHFEGQNTGLVRFCMGCMGMHRKATGHALNVHPPLPCPTLFPAFLPTSTFILVSTLHGDMQTCASCIGPFKLCDKQPLHVSLGHATGHCSDLLVCPTPPQRIKCECSLKRLHGHAMRGHCSNLPFALPHSPLSPSLFNLLPPLSYFYL